MARMLGRLRPSQCSTCRRPPGPDCDDTGKSKRVCKRIEAIAWRREAERDAIDAREDAIEDLVAWLLRPLDPDWRPPMTDQIAIDDLIDHWHDTGGSPDGDPVSLHEYLGMTSEEYARWLTAP